MREPGLESIFFFFLNVLKSVPEKKNSISEMFIWKLVEVW